MTRDHVTSLIFDTIAFLKGATEDYNIVKDDKALREAFHEAGRGLHLVEKALQTAEAQLAGRDLAGEPQGAYSALEACNMKAKLSQSLFKHVAQAPETSRFERYKEAVGRDGKESMVEVLVTGMMNDICDLAKDSAIEAAMKIQVKALRDMIDKLSTVQPSLPTESPGNTFSNYGSGNQFNAPGGTQNNNAGNGNQFPGATFSGTVHFGNNPS